MALVSYDYSDSSDYEDNEGDGDENNGKVSEVTLLGVDDKVNKEEDNTKEDKNKCNVSNDTSSNVKEKDLLPPPVEIKSNFNVVSWSLLSKSRTQPIRISVPSLEDEKDSEDSKPKLKPSSKKSGLFALLPKPKQQLLVPPSLNLRRQGKKKEAIKNRAPVPVLKTSIVDTTSGTSETVSKKQQSLDNTLDEDDDGEEEQPQSFFFIPEEKIVGDSNIEITNINDDLKESPSIENNVSSIQESSNISPHSSTNDIPVMYPESSSEIELNKEALEKLCGRRGKRLAGEVEMVDVSGAELVGDSKLWLAKELTTQKVHFKRSKFDPLQRRKHQITFLAAHARDQELELSNQWANNRMTRKQTQAKYGF